MSLPLTIYSQLNELPYFRNYQAVSGQIHNVSGHEDAVEDILVGNGLVKHDFSEYADRKGMNRKAYRDLLLSTPSERDQIPEGVYFSQPTGTHDSPDFIFKVGGRLIFLECKSSTECTPMYNGGLPKKGYVYHLSSKKENSSVMYLGEDIVNDAQRREIDLFQEKIALLVNELNKNLAAHDDQQRGLQYYCRHMWTQAGGKSKINYFEHINRAQAEENARALFE